MCLDMDGNNGNKVTVYSCSYAAWQQWWRGEGDTIRNGLNNGCLDIRNGDDAFVSDCNASNHQKWLL